MKYTLRPSFETRTMFRTLALGAAPDTWNRLGEGFGSEAVGMTYSYRSVVSSVSLLRSC